MRTAFILGGRESRSHMNKRDIGNHFVKLFSVQAQEFSTRGTRLFPEELNIIYDSKCNVCKLEIDFLRKRDAEKINIGKPKLKLTDLEDKNYDAKDPVNGGVTYEQGMAAIHAITRDGKVIKGVPVFAFAYEQVKLGWLFRITTWPVLKQIINVGYNIFAKYRTNLTRGASLGTLVKEYEAKKNIENQMNEIDCDTCESKK